MSKEIWKEIPILPGYQASNLGRVRSPDRMRAHSKTGIPFFQKGRILKPEVIHDGYWAVRYKPEDGCDHYRYAKVHRLIASAFIPNPENKPQINHKDGNRTNNALGNLEWATPLENTRHAYDILGYDSKGENNPAAKLTNEEAIEIRLLKFYGATVRDIAAAYRVTRRHIRAVCGGKTFKRDILCLG